MQTPPQTPPQTPQPRLIDPLPILNFLVILARCDNIEDRLDQLMGEVTGTSGTYTCPGPAEGAASHLFEITLHGVTGRGLCEPAALDDWCSAARRAITESDGFITIHPRLSPFAPFEPARTHAEEIANARAAECASTPGAGK